MAKVKLTESYIAAMPLPPSGKNRVDYDVDTRGLAVRITSSGFRSFLFCYMFDGRERRMPILTWIKGTGTLSLARSRAAELRLNVQKGNDPARDKEEARLQRERERQQAAKEATFAKLSERYLAEHAVHKRSGRADERRIKNYVLPKWSTRKVKDITRADVDELVSPIAAAGMKAEANHRLALVRKMFSFAVDRGIIDTHPCLRMKAPGGPIAPRDRALTTPREIKILWRITSGGRWSRIVPDAEARALRLMLLTACRPSEAAEVPWSEIDTTHALWILPASRSKNKRAHIIPLVSGAVSLVVTPQERVGEYVFPGQRSPHITENRLAGALRKACARLARLGLQPFTPHDLRRTVETGLAALKVPKEHRDRVLNHVDASVGGKHYNKYDYLDEKRDALQRWERRLESILQEKESVVVPMRARGTF